MIVPDLGQQLLGRHGRRVLDRLVDAEVADHGVQVGVGRQGAQVAEGGQLQLGVVDGAAHQHAQERQPAGLVQAAGDAVVEQGHGPVRPDEQVAAVQVAVEHAEEDGALQEADHQGPHHRRGVDAGRLHAGHVVEGEPAQALHDQDPAGDELRMGSGHDHRPLVGGGQHPGDVEHVVGLEAEVELLDDGLGEQLDQRRRVGQRRYRDAADEVGGDPAHGGQIRPHGRGDRGTLHFYHYLLARPEGGGVHLGDRRGGQRGSVEAGEELLERAAQILLHHGPDRLERLRRDPVAEEAELADQFRREDALARGEDLAQLDVGRAQGLERHPQPAGQAGPGQLGPALPAALAAFDQVPAADGPGQLGADPDHPAARGEAALAQQVGAPGRRWRPASRPPRRATAARSGSMSQGGVVLNAPTERSAGETEVIPSHATSALRVSRAARPISWRLVRLVGAGALDGRSTGTAGRRSAPPTSGATMNSHTWLRAWPADDQGRTEAPGRVDRRAGDGDADQVDHGQGQPMARPARAGDATACWWRPGPCTRTAGSG